MSNASPLLILSPATLEEIVARLPAADRAQWAWAPKRIADISASLLTDPFLTEGTIERALAEYLDAAKLLAPAVARLAAQPSSLAGLLQSGMQRDMQSLVKLPAVSAKAGMRAACTVMVVAQMGVLVVGQWDEAQLQQVMDFATKDEVAKNISVFRALVFLMAVFEGIRKGSPIPGRVALLARWADVAAKDFARLMAEAQPPIRCPWYDQTADGAAAAANYANWNPANLESHGPVTEEALQLWEQVKEGVDSARPHRKVFA